MNIFSSALRSNHLQHENESLQICRVQKCTKIKEIICKCKMMSNACFEHGHKNVWKDSHDFVCFEWPQDACAEDLKARAQQQDPFGTSLWHTALLIGYRLFRLTISKIYRENIVSYICDIFVPFFSLHLARFWNGMLVLLFFLPFPLSFCWCLVSGNVW